MVNIDELMEKLEQERIENRKRKIKRWFKMTFKDLDRLIKLVKNSGLDLGKVTITEAIKNLRG